MLALGGSFKCTNIAYYLQMTATQKIRRSFVTIVLQILVVGGSGRLVVAAPLSRESLG
jgi:hypothetical protein